MPRSASALLLGSALGGLAFVGTVGVWAAPVLHEYFEPDAAEDLKLKATTSDGTMAAAIRTPSGVVEAPDPTRTSPDGTPVYGAQAEAGEAPSYTADSDTTRPDRVSYEDPFVPAIPPFKRMTAFDAVGDDFQLIVKSRGLTPLPSEGTAQSGDDQFYGDMQVRLTAGEAVRIPSVGPGARVLVARTTPEVPFRLYRDSADNWFIKSSHNGAVRLIVQLAIPRPVFGSPYPDVAFDALQRVTVPANVRRAALQVATRLGLEPGARPQEIVETLVAYFRGFTPTTPVEAEGSEALYLALCEYKAGVCRHRSYAFAVTALALGIPTRFVHNEAHAWVEVSNGKYWHRIDLGGAAGEVNLSTDDRPEHVTPRDPYGFPPGSESGGAMVRRARRQAAAGGNDTSAEGNGSAEPSQASPSQAAPSGTDTDEIADGEPQGPSPDSAPDGTQGENEQGAETESQATEPAATATITLDSQNARVRRGRPLSVAGAVEDGGTPCAQVRVDLALVSDSGVAVPLGTLVTGSDGRFAGTLAVPFEALVGTYEVQASTPGRVGSCGAGSSRGD